MRVIEVNSGNQGSTGNIMLDIASTIRSHGDEAFVCYPDSRENNKKSIKHISTGNIYQRALHVRLGKLTGFNDCFSLFSTMFFCIKILLKRPDVIHLHNLHNCYLNLPLFFYFLSKAHIPIIWTLHDCWSFTGRCPHFSLLKCEKWESQCHECPYPSWQYPASNIDRSSILYKMKKRSFCQLENLFVVTPSKWLQKKVECSFLRKYPIQVIYNGIDLNVFKPSPSNFKEKYNIPSDKYLVLGVSFIWNYRKGLDVFVELSKQLSEEYQIILVGVDQNISSGLPKKILCISRTDSQQMLAEIYTAVDVFVNPTREEVLGMTNIEALACGTPVVAFATGGVSECYDETCGKTVYEENLEQLKQAIIDTCTKKLFKSEDCVLFAHKFNKIKKYEEYYALYKSITKKQY